MLMHQEIIGVIKHSLTHTICLYVPTHTCLCVCVCIFIAGMKEEEDVNCGTIWTYHDSFFTNEETELQRIQRT